MADSDESKAQSWWTTLPGILTGVAAVVTAVSGLIIAFYQVNGRDDGQGPAKQAAAGWQTFVREPGGGSASTPRGDASTATPSQAAKVELPLPAINEVKLNGGTTVVKILKAELEPFNTEKRALKFVV